MAVLQDGHAPVPGSKLIIIKDIVEKFYKDNTNNVKNNGNENKDSDNNSNNISKDKRNINKHKRYPSQGGLVTGQGINPLQGGQVTG